MAMFEWDRDANGQHKYKQVAAPCIRCLIVLHPCLVPGLFVYNHFLNRPLVAERRLYSAH